MARSRKKKGSRRAKSARNGRAWKILLATALAGGVVLIVTGFIGLLVLKRYLHSESFRIMVGEQTSASLGSEGEFERFLWEGKSVYSKSFSAEGDADAFFSRLKAHEVRADVSLAGIRRGVWEIPHVTIKRLDFLVEQENAETATGSDSDFTQDDDGDAPGSSGGGGVFSSLIPSEVEIQELRIDETRFRMDYDGTEIRGGGIELMLTPMADSAEEFSVAGNSGIVRADGFPELEIKEFKLHLGEDRVYVDHAEVAFYESARAQADGEIQFGAQPVIDLNGKLSGLMLDEVLPPDAAKKLFGEVNGDFGLRTDSAGSLLVSGRLGLRNGSLEAMPVLEQLDSMTRTTHFRKLVLTEVDVDFEKRGAEIRLNDVLFESAGLTCLKGHMARSADGSPSGMYMLGLSPDTIKWMPIGRKEIIEQVFRIGRDEAFDAVFPSARSGVKMPPEGYLWAVLRIDPSSPDPYTADIRRQVIDAGGLAIWAELQGLPEKVIKAAGTVAKVAGDQGVDVIDMLAGEGFGKDSLSLSAELIERMSNELKIEDVFEEGALIPRSIFDTGSDIINDLLPR